ncbi:hypothetical protein ATJ88_3208 [Isoptericola jiangsuensis]|uniref:Uncharacterized protein n=1 Tax=Isoptericola jiangsuensis TaxID=548579 RepID=A0A2A9F0G5_9MICO|nr:hypothetical protein [Isoptericola jiangsuensis]PFG44483.1 hypothetical protein ATJ88_3208 [Isoptericola jiangsuensis]
MTGAPVRRFEGGILGVGTTSGTRLVVGCWVRSPFGGFADVMVEDAAGRRRLLAPAHVAGFVASTYGFDDVVETDVQAVVADGAVRVEAGPLRLVAGLGGRTPLGRVLRLVPRRLAASSSFTLLTDPVAGLLLDGVRTRGSAGGGRRETYGAWDVHAVDAVRASWDGADLGALADVDPPVKFGFGSTPRRPSWTAVTTTVRG